jgi:tetratricopeptide (TPR) repeat protein/tRNA A-37 threonylcarbamoyl transferase component Bud32
MSEDDGPPDVSPFEAPVAPDGYRLVRLIGQGGMGEVFLADDLTLGRQVAIKFLPRERTHDPEARQRLLREARAAAAVDHPGICTVYEAGETPDGAVFVVMPYIDGEPLSSVLPRGPMAVRDALSFCAKLADALGAAHRKGIVHRDVKPANVMVTSTGAPKLLDLGIAKVVFHAIAGADASTISNASAPGTVLGTPSYMSPEQIQRRPIDGRSDLFSLGLVLYECLTGRRAFEGTSVMEVAGNILHVHPPAPSTIKSDVTPSVDELCRRLLAKDPADRFQSADEVVGAIRVLVPDTSRDDLQPVPARRRAFRRGMALGIAALTIVFASLAGWIWSRPRSLPAAPPDASQWYEQGVEAIRAGSYLTGRKALEQAVLKYPDYVQAYARLAEACAELDDANGAQLRLVRMSSIVPDTSRLAPVDRLRLEAVRALVLRDVDQSIAWYQELVKLHPDDAGAWLDLGRAQEAAGFRTAARESYERAIGQDRDYAAAYLRLGTVRSLELRSDEALAAFTEALRLYELRSDFEGQTEVLIRRGSFFDATGDLKKARADLERARRLAESSNAVNQQVRVQLALGNVTASDGAFDKAEELASEAVKRALDEGLDTAAADGLTDLAATLAFMGRFQEAIALAERALQLADRRAAPRTRARARLQLASVHEAAGRAGDAIGLVDAELPFLRQNRYRRFELDALSIKSRALERLDRLEEAREMAAGVLSVAETVQDEAKIAVASATLASVLTSLGRYPEALRLRERVETIRSSQGDNAALPYDLANRADVLIRLGRSEEADRVLAQLEAGIAARLPAYVGRMRRVNFLRTMQAAIDLRCPDVRRFAARIDPGGPNDIARALTPAFVEFCVARERRPAPAAAPQSPDVERAIASDRDYWLGAAALERGDAKAALKHASEGVELLGSISNDELRWRLAAVGSAAARRLDDAPRADAMLSMTRDAFERLRGTWKDDLVSYEQRPDLLYLRKEAGLATEPAKQELP